MTIRQPKDLRVCRHIWKHRATRRADTYGLSNTTLINVALRNKRASRIPPSVPRSTWCNVKWDCHIGRARIRSGRTIWSGESAARPNSFAVVIVVARYRSGYFYRRRVIIIRSLRLFRAKLIGPPADLRDGECCSSASMIDIL